MSTLTRRFGREEAQRIATLARLELTDPELDLYARQLTSILDYSDSLQAVDTNGVPPYDGTLPQGQWREDSPVPPLENKDALGNAPSGDTATGTFVVPKVIG
jgi:aspartyl-tRNA(Asn)/glutamyl-tRNA(Gln) amidotransferase subunit C